MTFNPGLMGKLHMCTGGEIQGFFLLSLMMMAFIHGTEISSLMSSFPKLSTESNNSIKHTKLSAVLKFANVPSTWLITETETFL
jgi:hypothetical protein